MGEHFYTRSALDIWFESLGLGAADCWEYHSFGTTSVHQQSLKHFFKNETDDVVFQLLSWLFPEGSHQL